MPPTNNWCYHDNNKVATQTKCIFRHPPTISNCMQNWRGGQNFSFPTLLDSYRELLLIVRNVNVRFNPLGQIFFFSFFFYARQPTSPSIHRENPANVLLCLANTKVINICGSFCCYRQHNFML